MNPSIDLISFIIPAYNEEFEIKQTLASVFTAAEAVGKTFEVIVVNDASSDHTPDIARATGARVVDVRLRQISAVRNAGARVAKGHVFFFIDADTQLSEATLRAALHALEEGAVGGGASVYFAEPMGWGIRLGITLFNFFYMRLLCWAAGCFVFSRREVFEAVGGFDESLYACEEIVLSRALKKQGRFVILSESVKTSGRKIHLYSPWFTVGLLLRFILKGPKVFRQRRGLEWWYDGKRETPRIP